MSNIPLDFQRKCEKRWVARFSRSVEAVEPRKHGPKQSQRIAAPGERKRKTRRDKPTGSRP
jgi:hypothetical protein